MTYNDFKSSGEWRDGFWETPYGLGVLDSSIFWDATEFKVADFLAGWMPWLKLGDIVILKARSGPYDLSRGAQFHLIELSTWRKIEPTGEIPELGGPQK